jgi:hypothetical protein
MGFAPTRLETRLAENEAWLFAQAIINDLHHLSRLAQFRPRIQIFYNRGSNERDCKPHSGRGAPGPNYQ